MASRLQIQLLGEFCLTYNGAPVTTLCSPRLRALLAYLIVHRGAPQPRQRLAFMLWPDSSEEQARTNLRNLIHLLRQALSDADYGLRGEGQVIFWEPDQPYTLDIVEFENAIAAGQMALAVELYAGDLLPECYLDWVAPERERLRQMYLAALERLAQDAEEAHNYESALGYALRLLREDPLCEAHCYRLMRLHTLTGNRAAALRAYHAFATALSRELGIEPSPATQRMYAQLLHNPAAPGPDAVATPTAPQLVGRQAEWAQLVSAWERTADGQSQLVLLSGDIGLGKSRLAEEMSAWVGRQGYPTAIARCYRAEGNLPYGPAIAWLRSRPPANLPPPWRNELARILPDVNEGRGPAAGGERHGLFEALAHAILAWGEVGPAELRRGAAAETLPILLVLDDIQWCDPDTLNWLHFLLREDGGGKLLIIAAIFDEETLAEQPLALLLASLRRRGLVTEIELGPLDRASTLALAEQIAGRSFDPALAEPLQRGSEGNPLFVVEMVRAGLSGPPDAQRQGAMLAAAALPFPPKLRHVLAARLAQLSPPALAVAQLTAVHGRQCRYDILAGAYDGSETELVQALDELWQHRILREVGDESYDFTHEKLREVCYDDMSAARRRLAGHRLAEAAGRAAGAR
ncbi:MAG: Transcriptional regulatory protein MoaR1 [Chloroflexi bacterium ADurb.Bin325]|nr:MAG: Transcriptional regulatory protein MoaR1 [Chloroflexi bacterium ADurb.Bin325]